MTPKELEQITETIYSHYKNNGGYTRTAAHLIEKISGQKWERDKEIDDLKAKIKELSTSNS